MKKTILTKNPLKIPSAVRLKAVPMAVRDLPGVFYFEEATMKAKEKAGMGKMSIGEARKGMLAETDKFRECNFEEFKNDFVEFTKQMIDFQFHLLDVLDKAETDMEKKAIAVLRKWGKENERDFKTIAKTLNKQEEDIAKARAASALAIILMNSMQAKLFRDVVMGKPSLAEQVKTVPPGITRFLASTMGVSQKQLTGLLEECVKAAA